MGDVNQYLWIKKYAKSAKGPVLEVGAKKYEAHTSFDYRSLFSTSKFVGTDLLEGDNVDITVDLGDFRKSKWAFHGQRFSTILCLSVLEHCRDPVAVARSIASLCYQDAKLFVSVPFTWRYHAYPDDYWRFTPSGIKVLFADFDFSRYPGVISSNLAESSTKFVESKDVNDFVIVKPLSPETSQQLTDAKIETKKKWNLAQKHPYTLLPSSINMVGIYKGKKNRRWFFF